jgi:hypothetical protein
VFVIDAPRRDVVTIFGTACMVALAVAFLRRTCSLIKPCRRMSIRRPLRAARLTRSLLGVSPTVRFLHTAAWAAGCLSPAALLSGHRGLSDICILLFFISLFFAGITDLVSRGTWLARRLWNETLGKIFSVSIGAILIALSIAAAKSWLHSVVQIDPKYFIESTAIFTAMLLPIMYCLFTMCLLGLLALVQFAGLSIFMLRSMFFQQLSPFAGQHRLQKIRMFRYRLTHGRRPPGNVLPAVGSGILDDMLVFARPLSTLAVIGALGLLLQALQNLSRAYQPYVTEALVALEYRSGSSCIGFEKALGVVYMDDGNVSVARRNGRNVEFSVEACKYKVEEKDG